MADDGTVTVEFEHRNGLQQGAVSLPTGLRDKSEISEGVFAVEFSANAPLSSDPTFRALVGAGHTPIADTVPEDAADDVQRVVDDFDGDDADEGEGGDESEDTPDAGGDESADGLDTLDRGELYEYAHDSEDVPDDAIPDWNDTTEGGLRDLIREHEG